MHEYRCTRSAKIGRAKTGKTFKCRSMKASGIMYIAYQDMIMILLIELMITLEAG